MLSSIKSLYSSVSSCVRLNGLKTDWFDVNCGLRQGCSLSPLLFNFYINDLATYLKATGIGIKVDEDIICILLYADDIVLLADSQQSLHILWNHLDSWCSSNDIVIDDKKSNVVHFRPNSINQCYSVFKCGESVV